MTVISLALTKAEGAVVEISGVADALTLMDEAGPIDMPRWREALGTLHGYLADQVRVARAALEALHEEHQARA